MSPELQERISAAELDRAWLTWAQDAGPAGEFTVRCHWVPGLAAADVTIAFAQRPFTFGNGFLPSGEIACLRFMRPNKTPSPQLE